MKSITSLLLFFLIGVAAHSTILGQSTSAPNATLDIVYSGNEVDEKLQIKGRVKAKYTEYARKNCINGAVRLRAIFRPNGKVENIEVIKGLGGGLNESAQDAIRKLKYRPARKGGEKVSVYAYVEYNFDYSMILPCKNGRRE